MINGAVLQTMDLIMEGARIAEEAEHALVDEIVSRMQDNKNIDMILVHPTQKKEFEFLREKLGIKIQICAVVAINKYILVCSKELDSELKGSSVNWEVS